MVFLMPLCVILCMFTFRARGGLFAGTTYAPSTQTARLAFASAAALTIWVAGATKPLALLTLPLWWVSSTFPLFGGIDLGTRDGTKLGDVAALFSRGLLWTILPALALCFAHDIGDYFSYVPHAWTLLIAGATMPLAYWLGKQSGIKWWGMGAIDWQQTGEVIYGAFLGVGIIVAVAT